MLKKTISAMFATATVLSLSAVPELAGQAQTSFGDSGSVSLKCWTEPDGYGGETVYSNWDLVSSGAPIWYANGDVQFSTGDNRAINGSPVGFVNTERTA